MVPAQMYAVSRPGQSVPEAGWLPLSPGAVFLYLKQHLDSTSYGNAWVVLSSRAFLANLQVVESTSISVKDKLAYIESAFNLRVVRLAELLGVSRQAIYDWKQGKSLSEENHRRLDALYRAARRFKEAGLKPDYNTMHRLIGGELEFIQALGQDPEEAVEKLIIVTERGRKQRANLEKLLKDLPEPKGSILDELPPHYPGE